MRASIYDGSMDDLTGLCLALDQAAPLLALQDSDARAFHQQIDRLRAQTATAEPDRVAIVATLKAIRHLLLESADGPLAPFLCDSVATLIGDGHGKLFQRPD